MASFGIVMAAPGASLPTVIERYGIDKLQAGALLSLLSFSVLAGSVVFGPVADRYGYRGMFIFAFATIVLGLEASAFAPTVAWLRRGGAHDLRSCRGIAARPRHLPARQHRQR